VGLSLVGALAVLAWLRPKVDRLGRNHYLDGMKAIVSEKGQVTIPKPLRERLGIRAGEVLEFEEQKGKLVATKTSPGDRVDAVYGILRLGVSTDELIRRMRGPGPDE